MQTVKTESFEIFSADMLDVLPLLSDIDAIITDPPYSSGGFTRGDRTLDTSKKYQGTNTAKRLPLFTGDNRDQLSYQYWMALWLSAALKASKPGALLMTFTDWRQLTATINSVQAGGWVHRGVCVWDKVNARPVPDRFTSQAEYIVWATNGPRAATPGPDSRYAGGVFRHTAPSSSVRQHSTQKPVALMTDLMKVLKPGSTVFDPFMGSGTTGEACITAGHKFIGVEMSPKYFQIAKERLEGVGA